jgi:thymidine kinase
MLNYCLVQDFHAELFAGSANMLAAMSMLEQFQAWSGERFLETRMCWEISQTRNAAALKL